MYSVDHWLLNAECREGSPKGFNGWRRGGGVGGC